MQFQWGLFDKEISTKHGISISKESADCKVSTNNLNFMIKWITQFLMKDNYSYFIVLVQSVMKRRQPLCIFGL